MLNLTATPHRKKKYSEKLYKKTILGHNIYLIYSDKKYGKKKIVWYSMVHTPVDVFITSLQ